MAELGYIYKSADLSDDSPERGENKVTANIKVSSIRKTLKEVAEIAMTVVKIVVAIRDLLPL